MKKLCLILAFLFLFTQTASAMPLLIGQKVVYRGTVTGLRISAVDGTAFIDNLPYTYSSYFSVGVDGWIAIGGTLIGNIDSIGGEDNWIRLTSSSVNEVHFLYKNLFTKGKAYTITLKYYIPSTNSNVDGIKLSDGYTLSSLHNTTDTVSTASFTVATKDIGFRVYAYDGTAQKFQDAGGDDVFYIKDITISEITPYIDGNHQIEIYDSDNRMLRGVLKAAGSSETLSTIIDTSFDEASEWTAGTGWTVDDAGSSQAVGVAGTASYLVSSSAQVGTKDSLLKIIFTGTVSSTSIQAALGVGQGAGIVGTTTFYFNNRSTGSVYGLYKNATGACIVDALFIGKVTDPSALGATIVSAKGGDVYNFSYKNASFTYNAASYYVIIRAIR